MPIKTRRKEMFYLTTHSSHFIYGYMASDISLRIIPIVRKETRCRHICYYFRVTARVILYAPSHRQDSTYHGFVTPVVEHWLTRRKEMFYLMTHFSHFIYGYKTSNMVKEHSDSERRNPLPSLYGLLFPIFKFN